MGLFQFESCANCGEGFSPNSLKAYKGNRYCASCLKKVKAKDKVECPFCHNKYKNLKRHLKTCDHNPENKVPEPSTPTLSLSPKIVAPVLEETRIIQDLTTQLEQTQRNLQLLQDQVNDLRENFQLVGKQLPETFQSSIESLVEKLIAPIQGQINAPQYPSRDSHATKQTCSLPPIPHNFTDPPRGEILVLMSSENKIDWRAVYDLAERHGWTLNYFTFLLLLRRLDTLTDQNFQFYQEWIRRVSRGLDLAFIKRKFKGFWTDFAGLESNKRNKFGKLARRILKMFIDTNNRPMKSREIALRIVNLLRRPADYNHIRQVQNAVGRLHERGTLGRDDSTHPAKYFLADCRPGIEV